jgi:hypothetical protein
MNPAWHYNDARGVAHTGYVERTVDHGGTDVTYYFRDSSTGELSLVSGPRLREATRLHGEVVPIWRRQR